MDDKNRELNFTDFFFQKKNKKSTLMLILSSLSWEKKINTNGYSIFLLAEKKNIKKIVNNMIIKIYLR